MCHAIQTYKTSDLPFKIDPEYQPILPLELLNQIFSLFNLSEMRPISVVCKHWNITILVLARRRELTLLQEFIGQIKNKLIELNCESQFNTINEQLAQEAVKCMHLFHVKVLAKQFCENTAIILSKITCDQLTKLTIFSPIDISAIPFSPILLAKCYMNLEQGLDQSEIFLNTNIAYLIKTIGYDRALEWLKKLNDLQKFYLLNPLLIESKLSFDTAKKILMLAQTIQNINTDDFILKLCSIYYELTKATDLFECIVCPELRQKALDQIGKD